MRSFSQVKEVPSRKLLFQAVFFSLLCALAFSISSLFPQRAHAEYKGKLTFAETLTSGLDSERKYTVKIKGDPRLPQNSDILYGIARLDFKLYNIGEDLEYNPDHVSSYTEVFSARSYRSAGENTWSVSEYVAESKAPQEGQRLAMLVKIESQLAELVDDEYHVVPAAVVGSALPTSSLDDDLPAPPSTSPDDSREGEQTAAVQIKVFDSRDSEPLSGVYFKLTTDEEGNRPAQSTDGTKTFDTLISNTSGELELNGESLKGIRLAPGVYYLHQLKPFDGYQSLSPKKINLGALSGFKTETVEMTEGKDPVAIPYEVIDGPWAVDAQNFFVKLKDAHVHPIYGLRVTVIFPDESEKELVDARVNFQNNLVMTPADFTKVGEEAPAAGSYKLRLKQSGYLDTLVPVTLAERTARPVLADSSAEHLYKEDDTIEFTAERGAKIYVSFMDSPISEDNIVEIESGSVDEYPAGTFTLYVAKYRERIASSKVLKIVAQASGKAKSEPVVFSLKDKRTGHISVSLHNAQQEPLKGAEFKLSTDKDGTTPAMSSDKSVSFEHLVTNDQGVLSYDGKALSEYELDLRGYFLIQTSAPQGYTPLQQAQEIWLSKQAFRKELSLQNEAQAHLPSGADARASLTLAIEGAQAQEDGTLRLSAEAAVQPLTIAVSLQYENLIAHEPYTLTLNLYELDKIATRSADQPSATPLSTETLSFTPEHASGSYSASLSGVQLKPDTSYRLGFTLSSHNEIVEPTQDYHPARHILSDEITDEGAAQARPAFLTVEPAPSNTDSPTLTPGTTVPGGPAPAPGNTVPGGTDSVPGGSGVGGTAPVDKTVAPSVPQTSAESRDAIAAKLYSRVGAFSQEASRLAGKLLPQTGESGSLVFAGGLLFFGAVLVLWGRRLVR